MFSGSFRVGFVAGIFRIMKLAKAPTMANPSSTQPIITSCPRYSSLSTPPHTVPRMTARKLSDSRSPLPLLSKCGGRISGITPYLAGTKNAECMPMRNTQPSTIIGPSWSWPFTPSLPR